MAVDVQDVEPYAGLGMRLQTNAAAFRGPGSMIGDTGLYGAGMCDVFPAVCSWT